MRKRVSMISLIIILFLINLISANIRINEVELNPYDGNKQWIELYSDNAMNLDGWKIIEKNNRTKTLTTDIQNHLVIELPSHFLENESEIIRLFNQTSLIYQTPILSDNYSDSKTWNYCVSNWSFSDSSPGTANKCPVKNQTIPKNDTSPTGPKPEIILSLDWNGNEIINGRDFDIEVSAFNLEDKKYDVKVYIYRDNNENKIISETYYHIDWFYSGIYITEFFTGPGNKTEEINLRISEVYRNFNGSAKIKAKIKEQYPPNVEAEKESNINILKEGTETQQPNMLESQAPVTGEVIKIEGQGNVTVTPPRSDNFIFYFISTFMMLIVIFLILLVIRIFR